MTVVPGQTVHFRPPVTVGPIGEARVVRLQGVARLQGVVGNAVELGRVARKPGDIPLAEDDDRHGDIAEFGNDRPDRRITALAQAIHVEVKGLRMSRARLDVGQADAVSGEGFERLLQGPRTVAPKLDKQRSLRVGRLVHRINLGQNANWKYALLQAVGELSPSPFEPG